MDRRKFLKNIIKTSATVAVAPTIIVTAVAAVETVFTEEKEYVWELLGARDRNRDIVLHTNLEGMKQFDKAVKEVSKDWSVNMTKDNHLNFYNELSDIISKAIKSRSKYF